MKIRLKWQMANGRWQMLLLVLGMSASCQAQNLLPAFLGPPSGVKFPYDSEESYSDNAAVNALNGGTGWGGAYADTTAAFGVQSFDTIESYSDGANLDALNSGTAWGGAYVDATGYTGVKASDTMESYSDTAALNGLNGGSSFGGAFSDRP